MNNTTTKRKSDYKIAKLNNPLQQQQHFISDTDTDTNSNTDTDSSTNGNNNKNNNNKTNKNKPSNSTPTLSRFATLQSSPSQLASKIPPTRSPLPQLMSEASTTPLNSKVS